MSAYVYIITSKRNGTLYTGVTNDLLRRIAEHRSGIVEGFSKAHGATRLIYYEQHETVPLALQREKNIKHWSRDWKLNLIEESNPQWKDLWEEIAGV